MVMSTTISNSGGKSNERLLNETEGPLERSTRPVAVVKTTKQYRNVRSIQGDLFGPLTVHDCYGVSCGECESRDRSTRNVV